MENWPERPKLLDPSVIPPLSATSNSPSDSNQPEALSVARPKKLIPALKLTTHWSAPTWIVRCVLPEPTTTSWSPPTWIMKPALKLNTPRMLTLPFSAIPSEPAPIVVPSVVVRGMSVVFSSRWPDASILMTPATFRSTETASSSTSPGSAPP